MKKIVYFWVFCLQLLLGSFSCIAQHDLVKQSNTTRPAYLSIAVGLHYSTFRDFATSPIFYNGTPKYVALSHIDFDKKRTSDFQLSHSFGTFRIDEEHSEAVSKVRVFAIDHTELFAWAKTTNSRIKLKMGGRMNSTINIRNNEAFGNNSEGFEVISTLFGSINGSIDLRRNEAQLKRNLSFSIHIGLVNTSYRNGFIYTRQSPLLNQDNINEGYKFSFFSGYRMNSSVEYFVWLKNRNAVQLSYQWDIYNIRGIQNGFEMATHSLKISILTRLN